MTLKYELIKLLADGAFHSGEALGNRLQVSRSAIWKSIQQLREMGLEINSLKGKGYQIPTGLELLDKDRIKRCLPPALASKIQLEIVQEIGSTNQYLLDQQKFKPSGSVIFAEYQTQGKGRRQRNWFSPFGHNLYCSILWTFDKDPSELGGLSLAAGVAVANTLEKYGLHPLQLKWPNDILYNNKKLSGILIEMTAETHANTHAIIGIGINLQMPTHTVISQPWTDIASVTGQRPQRNLIASHLITELVDMLVLFQEKGFNHFFNYWQLLDACFGKPILLHTPNQVFQGTGNGISRQGEFILLDEENNEIRFLQGEVSLHISPTFPLSVQKSKMLTGH